jgi:signal transduction histidine kinase
MPESRVDRIALMARHDMGKFGRLWPLVVAAPLALASVLSQTPGPWLMLATVVVLTRFCLPLRGLGATTLPIVVDCITCLMLAVLSGHIGLSAAAWLALLPLHGARPGTMLTAGASTLAGLAATQFLPNPGILVPAWFDLFGTAAAALQAGWLWRCRTAAETSATHLPLDALSHELRTPLNAIIGFAGLLRTLPAGQCGPERQHDYARIIETSGEHILAILETASQTPGAPHRRVRGREANDVAAVVRSAMDMMTVAAAKRDIKLSLADHQRLSHTPTDGRALRQILINLLTNAIKFSPDHSDIDVALTNDAGYLEVSVRDQGLGMSRADIGRLGRPFVRGRKALEQHIEGSGLGLAISMQLADQMKGSLGFVSAPGRGTTAKLRLPLPEETMARRWWPAAADPMLHPA